MSVATADRFGSAPALLDDVARLRRRADAAEDLAHRLRRTDVGWWSGEAADAFADALDGVVRDVLRAADDAVAAADVIERHADVVAWADRRLAAARPATPSEAEMLLATLHDDVDASARRAADALAEITAGTARMPGVLDVVLLGRDQYWGGMGDAVAAMVQSSWQVQLVRHVVDPLGSAAQEQAMGEALRTGLRDDPAGLVRDLVDWDTWRTDPIRVLGGQVPDAILSAATAGTGAGASAAARAARAAREGADALATGTRLRPFGPRDAAAAAGHTVEGQRTPGWVTPEGWAVPEWLARAAERIPEEWGVAAPNKKGIGFRWFGENASHEGVRVDAGNPDHRFATQRVDHVVVRSGGRVLGRDGLPLPDESIVSDVDASHIPLTEWMTWTDWSTP